MPSIQDRITETDGRSTGFDYLRLGLAVAILIFHVWLVAYGQEGRKAEVPSWLYAYVASALVPCFFALSGYLVAGSLDRCKTVLEFAALRILRIFPALAVETLLSAFIIGPLFTALPLSDYFASPVFLSYLLNLIGDVHFELPGVFETNPDARVVNSQLWTIPYELYCYVLIIGIALLGRNKRRNITICLIAACSVYIIGHVVGRYVATDLSQLWEHYDLVLMFLTGAAIFYNRTIIEWRWSLALLGVALWVVAATFYKVWMVPGWLGLSYATVYVGLLNPYKPRFMRAADFSYGIFLYHYAILQSVAAVIGPPLHWTVILFWGLPLSVFAAALSWRYIEKPAHGLRRYWAKDASTPVPRSAI